MNPLKRVENDDVRAELAAMRADIKSLKETVEKLDKVFTMASGAVLFIKIAAATVAVIVGAWMWLANHVHFLPK
jgi:hypothetical protein